jgi:hypothetical protein
MVGVTAKQGGHGSDQEGVQLPARQMWALVLPDPWTSELIGVPCLCFLPGRQGR